MRTELVEARLRKFYEDKAEAANKAYQKLLYEVALPSNSSKILPEKKEEQKDHNTPVEFKLKKKLTPEEEAEDREFWKAYRREKEKQKYEQRR